MSGRAVAGPSGHLEHLDEPHPGPPDAAEVSLDTLYEDLTGGFTDLKTTLVSGFRSLPTPESGEEMVGIDCSTSIPPCLLGRTHASVVTLKFLYIFRSP
jgi:hypothetical protein